MALMTPVEKKEREYLKSYGAERERESNGFPEEHTRKIASERERKKGREYKAWNTETNIKRRSEF